MVPSVVFLVGPLAIDGPALLFQPLVDEGGSRVGVGSWSVVGKGGQVERKLTMTQAMQFEVDGEYGELDQDAGVRVALCSVTELRHEDANEDSTKGVVTDHKIRDAMDSTELFHEGRCFCRRALFHVADQMTIDEREVSIDGFFIIEEQGRGDAETNDVLQFFMAIVEHPNGVAAEEAFVFHGFQVALPLLESKDQLFPGVQ